MATTAELTEGARQLPRVKKPHSGFVCHYGNQAPSILQTENRRLRQIGNVLFCQSQSFRLHFKEWYFTSSIKGLFLHASTEEEGLNES